MGHDEHWKRAATLMASREAYRQLPAELRGQLIQDIRAALHEAAGLPPPEEKEAREYGYTFAVPEPVRIGGGYTTPEQLEDVRRSVPLPPDLIGRVVEGVSPPEVVAEARRRGVCVYTKEAASGERCPICHGPAHEMSCQ